MGANDRRSVAAVLGLVAGSVGLHAALFGGLIVGLPSLPTATAPREAGPTVTTVVLVAAPPAVAPAPAAVPPPPARTVRARPVPATPAPFAPVGLAPVEAVPIGGDAFGAIEPAEAPAADAGPLATASADTAPPPEPAATAGAEPPAQTAQGTTGEPPALELPLAATPRDDAVRGPLPAPPADHRQRFRVYWGDFAEERSVASLEYRFERQGDSYLIESAGQAEGLLAWVYRGTLVQRSSGRVGPDGLEPARYVEQRGSRPERAVSFDARGQRLLPTGGEPVALPAGTQDRLSVFYQIGLLVRAEPERFTAGRHYELPVASTRAVARERFEVVGDQVLMAPGGPIRALHLHRPPRPGSGDPRIDLWLGYDHEMLPVRLRIEEAQRRVLDHLIETGS